jgi:hypothetical protein
MSRLQAKGALLRQAGVPVLSGDACKLPEHIDPLGLAVVHDGSICLKAPAGNLSSSPLPRLLPQRIDLEGKEAVSFANLNRLNSGSYDKYVHCFVEDRRCERAATRPWMYVERLAKAYAVATPDLSIYQSMPLEEQFLSAYLGRMAGRIWQAAGLHVIPTLSWSDERSLPFLLSGICPGMTVAVSTLGTRRNKRMFMLGFKALCEVSDLTIVCYDRVYPEMWGMARIIPVEHDLKKASRLAKLKPRPGQLQIEF